MRGALRYALIGLKSRAKSAREAREGGNHIGREGGSPLILARARKDFQSHFSKSFFWEKKNLDMFLGSFRDVKTYSEQKRFMGQDF